MNSHERFEKTLNLEKPDRPLIDMLWPRVETINALKEHFAVDSLESVLQKLHVDFRWSRVDVKYEDFDKRVNGKLTGDAPGSGSKVIFHDNGDFEDAWGIVQRVGADGKYLEWVSGPLVGKTTIDNWQAPKQEYASVAETKEKISAFKDNITIAAFNFPFKIAWHLWGYENFMMAMLLHSEEVHKLYDILYNIQEKKACIAAEAGFDIIALVGDVAGQTGLMFSPNDFLKFDVPRMKKLIKSVKNINPNVKMFYHSDGQMETIIPHLIEAGVDILNPIQSTCMDIAGVKKDFGDKISFHGTICVQDLIPNKTPKEIKETVKSRINSIGHNGGLFLSNENSFPYDAPLENILAFYETALDG